MQTESTSGSGCVAMRFHLSSKIIFPHRANLQYGSSTKINAYQQVQIMNGTGQRQNHTHTQNKLLLLKLLTAYERTGNTSVYCTMNDTEKRASSARKTLQRLMAPLSHVTANVSMAGKEAGRGLRDIF